MRVLDLLLPRPCACCGGLNGPCCRGCRSTLPVGLIEQAVPLGFAVGSGGGPADTHDLLVAASASYADDCRRLLLAFKEGGRHELAPLLGELLARAALGAVLLAGDASGRPLLLVPVPSRPSSRRARGADLGLLLARRAAAALRGAGWPARAAPLLRHRSNSVDQAGLTRGGRTRNVAGTLVAVSSGMSAGLPARAPTRSGTAGGPANGVAGHVSSEEGEAHLLLDDILTTGATLREAARALHASGRSVRAAAVVAATPLNGTPLSSPGGGG